jgi:hypothetical protein
MVFVDDMRDDIGVQRAGQGLGPVAIGQFPLNYSHRVSRLSTLKLRLAVSRLSIYAVRSRRLGTPRKRC